MMSYHLAPMPYHDWQAAITRADFVPLQQSWGYGAAVQAFGVRVSRLGLYRGEELIGLAQITHKRLARLIPLSLCMRGPLWLTSASDDDKTALYQQLQRKRFPSLWMPEHDDHAALHTCGAKRVMTGYHTVMLDLTQPIDVLRAGLDGKWRNRLVAAERAKLPMKRLQQPADYRFVLQAEATQSRLRRYGALPAGFVPLYQLECGERAVYAIAALHRHEPVAALICLLHDGGATYHIGWSTKEGKRLNAHNRLLWRAVKELKAQGVRQLDLGGVNTEPGSAGIARFKLGTGGTVSSLPGTYF